MANKRKDENADEGEIKAKKKASLLLILKILEKYSNEPSKDDKNSDCYLTQAQIIDILENEYGVKLDRKSVSNSILLLQRLSNKYPEDFNFEISQPDNRIGYAITKRTFELEEARLLDDSIYSSKLINRHEASELIKKINSTFSVNQQKLLPSLSIHHEEKGKNDKNQFLKETLLNVQLITEAINQKKRVIFNYIGFDNNGNRILRRATKDPSKYRKYAVSPYYLVNNNGRYYLLCNYKRFKTADESKYVSAFKIDYMKNVSILENDEDGRYRTIAEVNAIKDENDVKFDINSYLATHMYIFGDDTELINAKFKSTNPKRSKVDVVKDWFGDKAMIYEKDGNCYFDVKIDKDSLIYWSMQYGEDFIPVAPSYFVEEVKKALQKRMDLLNKPSSNS